MSRDSNKEKRRFLDIARSSLSEARTQSYIGIEIGYITNDIGSLWVAETKELHAMIYCLKNSIETK